MPNLSTDRLFPASRTTGLVLVALLALSMLATRYHHFGSALHLADTSWAAFFLAGLWFRSARPLAGLLAVAVAVDLGSIALDGGTMAACFSPAYPGALLAYTALWGAGRMAGRWLSEGRTSMATGMIGIAAALLSGVTAAFVIANATFWAFSGQFEALAAGEYMARVTPYLAGYLGTAAGYTAIGLAGLMTVQQLRANAWRLRHG